MHLLLQIHLKNDLGRPWGGGGGATILKKTIHIERYLKFQNNTCIHNSIS